MSDCIILARRPVELIKIGDLISALLYLPLNPPTDIVDNKLIFDRHSISFLGYIELILRFAGILIVDTNNLFDEMFSKTLLIKMSLFIFVILLGEIAPITESINISNRGERVRLPIINGNIL